MDRPTASTQATGLDVIDHFNGPHQFLSNFHRSPFIWEGRLAATAEHHYNAAKTTDPIQRATVYEQPTPRRAKTEGRRVTLREGWDDHLKGDVMASILAAKFAPGTPLAHQLLSTGEALLIEGNTWHDQYWGQCGCQRHYHWPGTNTLGRLLMRRRTTLRDLHQPLTRVGLVGNRLRSLTPAEATWAGATLTHLLHSLKEHHGARVLISSMGPGVDQLGAQAAIDEGLRLWAYLPSPDEAARLPVADRDAFTHLLSHTTRTVTLGASHDQRWLRASSDLLVRDSSVVVVVHKEGGPPGGASSVIRKARTAGARMLRVNVTRRTVVAVTTKGEQPWDY